MIFANPIPEKYSLDGDKMEKVIEEAVKDADEKGVKGKDLTPFLLAKIVELTGGESLEANIALIKNNAKVAAQISLALNK
jgi:pseudouridine-5'-phosphate glycosidase